MSADTLTVVAPVESSLYPGFTPPATFPALAGEAVADAMQYTDTEAHVVVAESDRFDPDAVEHTRQSRLQRFQEQR